MSKNITIIGAGISGLTLLHYLKSKYAKRGDISIKLLEKSDSVGGTIRTVQQGEYYFETGPNGFLASKPATLELIHELGLDDSLLPASDESNERFISLNNILYQIPVKPPAFLKFKLFSFADKLRVLQEFFIAKGSDPDESIYDFGARRLGEKFVDLFLDPMVSGVFAGDVKQLNLKYSFPRIYEIEQTYGSLMRGALSLALTKKPKPKESRINVQPKGHLTSFKKGMSELIDTLYVKHKDSIILNEEVEHLQKANNRFIIQTNKRELSSEEVFMCTPAYVAGATVFGFNNTLCEALKKIYYAPVAVVGFVYKKEAFQNVPRGFGYINPSKEKKEALGVLFSSNIFKGRAPDNSFLCQVMIGGARNPSAALKNRDELVTLAKSEIRDVLGAEQEPTRDFVIQWQKGIPQYNLSYPELLEKIHVELNQIRGLHLVANYIGGISLNDCIANAKTAVENS